MLALEDEGRGWMRVGGLGGGNQGMHQLMAASQTGSPLNERRTLQLCQTPVNEGPHPTSLVKTQ